jgi:hypothetical protein
MYAVLWWVVLAICVAAVCGAIVVLARKGNLTGWDLGLLFAPFALWIVLVGTNLRPKSLANLIELFALVPVVALAFVARIFRVRAQIVFGCGVLVALLLYAFVPLLPE